MHHDRARGDIELAGNRFNGMPAQQQPRDFPLAVREHVLAEVLETMREALVHTRLILLHPAGGGSQLPRLEHRRPNDRLDQIQAPQFGLAEHPLSAAHDQNQRCRGIDIEQKVHFVEQMRALAILPVVLTRTEAVRALLAKSAQRRLAGTQGELIQRIEQIGPGEITVEIVPGASRFDRVVQYLWRLVVVKREQAGAFVIDCQPYCLD